MKKMKKSVSALLTMAMAASILMPGAAALAATDNKVMSVPSVEDDGVAELGDLYIEEESNSFKATTESFVVTLPVGVKYDHDATGAIKAADISKFVEGTVGVVDGVTLAANKRSITVKFVGTKAVEDNMTLHFPVKFDGFAGGDVKVTIDSLDSRVNGGEYIVARAGSAGTTATALSVETIGEGSAQEAGVIRITETAVGALKEGEQIKLTLPNDFTWNKTEMAKAKGNVVALGGFPSDVIKDITFEDSASSPKKMVITLKDDEKGELDALSKGQRGIIEITPFLDVDSDADYGEVEVDVEGTDVDDATVVIAKYADFGVGVTAKSVEEVLAGKMEEELGKIVIKEDIKGSLVGKRNITIELPENVKISEGSGAVKVSVKSGTSAAVDTTPVIKDSHKIEIPVKDSTDSALELEVHFKKVNLAADVTGDIAAKVSGRAGIEKQEVVIGKAIAPITATVSKKANIKLGMQAQPIGDILITEAKKGAIEDSDKDQAGQIVLEAPEGVKFATAPKVEVVEGNVSVETVKRASDDRQVVITFDGESTKPSSLKVTNLSLTVDRTVPVGDVGIKIKGDAIAETYEGYNVVKKSAESTDYEFTAATVVKVIAAQVVNPAPDAGSVLFNIGSSIYTVNGIAKVMDAAPYVKEGRTYVPVRYLALALGVNEDDIGFENGVVTLTKGDVTLKMTIGSKNLDNNGTITTMDAAPEVVNGRTMLPARFVAEGFGAQVGFANGQVVIAN